MKKKGRNSLTRLATLSLSIVVLSWFPYPGYRSMSLAADCSRSLTAHRESLALKSTDGGASWNTLVDPRTDFLAHRLNRIVIDPLNTANIYLATNNGVFKTDNGGCSWTDSSDGLTERFIRDLVIDPGSPNIVYALTAQTPDAWFKPSAEKRIFISRDSGKSWASANFNYDITCLAAGPGSPSTVYLGASSHDLLGIYKSTDAGETFTLINQRDNPSSLSFGFIVVDPEDPSVLYYSLNTPSGESNPLRGLYKSTDGGAEFTFVRQASPNPSFLVIDPENHSTLYTGGNIGLLKSTDGGSSWAAVLLRGSGFFSPASFVIDSRRNLYMTIVIQAGYQGSSPYLMLLKSADEGDTWTYLSSGSTTASPPVVDPLIPSVIYRGEDVESPEIDSPLIRGKKVVVLGSFIHAGAVIKINGEEQQTEFSFDPASGTARLIARKGAKHIAPGQQFSVSIKETDGVEITVMGIKPY
jgi:hypothetical protein